MTSEHERAELLIHRAEGNGFQTLFVQVMSQRYQEFTPIKAYGPCGDGGNDGWLTDSGTFFQVYGPEDIRAFRTMNTALEKIEKDAYKIIESRGEAVKAWRFVINDKFAGIPEPIDRKVMDVAAKLSLPNTRAVGSHWLVGKMFQLPRHQLLHVLGLNDHQAVIEDMRRVQDFLDRTYYLVSLLQYQRDNDAGWSERVRTFVDHLDENDARIVAADELSAHEAVYGTQIKFGEVVKKMRQIIDSPGAQTAGTAFAELKRQAIDMFDDLANYADCGTPPAPDASSSIVRNQPVFVVPESAMRPHDAPTIPDPSFDLSSGIMSRQSKAAQDLVGAFDTPTSFDSFAAEVKQRQIAAATAMFGTPSVSPSTSHAEEVNMTSSGNANTTNTMESAYDKYRQRQAAAARALFRS